MLAQLIGSVSRAHLWADRFEEDAADLFKLEDEVVARLVGALSRELVKADGEAGAHQRRNRSQQKPFEVRGRE